MTRDEAELTEMYRVVANEEEQYSIWLARRELPAGWRAVGKEGPKGDCMAYIAEVWTDTRPLSVRSKMKELEASPPDEPATGPSRPPEAMDALVERLTKPQAIELPESYRSTSIREAIQRQFVHVRFPGDTQLGVRLEQDRCSLKDADLDARRGKVTLVGTLTLNCEKVRCHAEVDLSTFRGKGHLEYLGPSEAWRRELVHKP